jgi:hypothetical protein
MRDPTPLKHNHGEPKLKVTVSLLVNKELQVTNEKRGTELHRLGSVPTVD